MHRRALLFGLPALALASACRARVGALRSIPAIPGTLRVITLNLAHGRGRAAVQSRARSAAWYRRNLEAIAAVLRRERPDVVALQEAELGSQWAGEFDHVRYLAERADLPYVHATPHMDEPPRYRYGTAIISRFALREANGGTFATGGRWHKGWTAAIVETPSGPVRAISVHLDFISIRRRRRQVAELARALRDPSHPLVVMGDFNSTWSRSDRSAVAGLARTLGLDAFRVEDAHVSTFGSRRIDWILVSSSLDFAQRRVLTDDLSDHRPILADLTTSTS